MGEGAPSHAKRRFQCEQLDAKNFKTGCSSIAFGAIPVCPCGMSKKPTPVTVALPLSLVNRLDQG